MPDCTGFDVLDRLAGGQRPFVGFVTAHDEYALRALDAHAIAYLLQPFDDSRFNATIAHVRRLLLHDAGTTADGWMNSSHIPAHVADSQAASRWP